MKKTSKCGLMIVAILSLCSCGKGTKTTKEKFFEKVNEIDFTKSFKKAKLTGTHIIEKTYNNETEKKKEPFSGVYELDASGKWISSSDQNHELANECIESFFEMKVASFTGIDAYESCDEESITEQYYIKPFGYDYSHTYSVNFDDGLLKEEFKYEENGYCEWNKFGWLVACEASFKEKRKEISSSGEITTITNIVINAKISYK